MIEQVGTQFSRQERVSEIYAYIVSSYTDNLVTATKLANNVMFANMETFRASLQQVKDSLRDLSKIGVNAVKTFEHASAETVRQANVVEIPNRVEVKNN